MDAATLNARLKGGHRLLVTRDSKGQAIKCEVEFFGEDVPLALFNSYLANGMLEVPKDGLGYKLSTVGRDRIK